MSVMGKDVQTEEHPVGMSVIGMDVQTEEHPVGMSVMGMDVDTCRYLSMVSGFSPEVTMGGRL